jgi:hypothetical protein
MQRPLLPLPPPAPPSLAIRSHCERIDALTAAAACRPRAPADYEGMAAAAARLAHPLAGHALQRNGSPAFRQGTTAAEIKAARTHGAALVAAWVGGDPEIGRQQLVAVARAAGSAAASPASGSALAADGQGVHIRFAGPAAFDERFRAWSEWLALGDGSRAWRATVMQAALLNVHPLGDGNGRASRVLFNSLLWGDALDQDRYLPTYELRRFAPYTFEIVLRRAEIQGDWEPLVRLHRELLEAHEHHVGRTS